MKRLKIVGSIFLTLWLLVLAGQPLEASPASAEGEQAPGREMAQQATKGAKRWITADHSNEERGKPDPAVYLTTARRLGVPPTECVAIEDSVRGVQAGLAAGVRVGAVPTPDHFDAPGFDVAHVALRSLEDLSVEDLRARGW